MSLIPHDARDYNLDAPSDTDPFLNDDTTEAARILLSIHYHIDGATDPDGLRLIDEICAKCIRHGLGARERVMPEAEALRLRGLCEQAKRLIRAGRVGYTEALTLLFSRADLECFGY